MEYPGRGVGCLRHMTQSHDSYRRSMRSGDGFVIAGDGQPRWGRYGAAGVLVRHVDGDDHWYFLALRSEYTHRGGTWAIPGGALDEHETPLDGARREFAEELGHGLRGH